MNICVCIKQVPASSNVKINPDTGTLVRDGDNTKINPYDLYALELALKVKEQKECNVKAITMGPPAATAILEEALYMGCDDGYLITDRKFAGADVVATAYTISQGIRKVGDCDLIICGKQTTDGDTAQVGAELAHFLGIPFVCYVD
jgi:electron transfer flavoprotein beta subunit